MHELVISRGCSRLVVSTIVSVLLLGCVSQGTYDAVVQERDQYRDRAQSMEAVATDLGDDLALREREVALLQIEQQELADEVTRWAVRGAIKMEMLADGLHLILPHDVLFASGATSLSPEGDQLIVELVEELKQQPYQIAVLGFTDNVPVGPQLAPHYPSNWELSGARAASVVRVMQREGVPASQLVAVARGETQPIAPNDTPEGRAQNRRIDVRIRPIIK